MSMERITLLLSLGSNMDGTAKLKPLVIGKSQKPRCIKHDKWLPVDCRWNKKAWMTGNLFEDGLKQFDQRMTRQKRQVVLLIDNCPAHPHVKKLKKFVKLVFLPLHSTSKTQPMDQGVIKSFKQHYRHKLL